MSSADLGTKREPRYFEAAETVDGETRMSTRLFTYATDKGIVAGWIGSVVFSIERPAGILWPIFKDLNRWMGATEHVYSKVFGDSEGQKVLFQDQAQASAGSDGG